MSKWYQFFKQDIIINQVNAKPDEKGAEDVNEKVAKEPLDRIRESLLDWSNAITSYENPFIPIGIKRQDIFNLFRNIALDPHLFALTETIYNRIRETPFKIYDKNGNIQDDKTELFKRSWFSKFLRYVVEAEYWGFSLIQFLGLKDGSFSDVTMTNRFYVRPEVNGVSKGLWDDEVMMNYDKKPYSDWMMFVEGKTYLGRYNIVAKRFILKREIVQFWAVFNELHTTKNLVVKTKFNNAPHRNALITSMENRKHSNFNVIDHEDEVIPVDSGGQGYISYKDFEESVNEAMSKAFIGSTMVTDDGSSYSQANVHESNTASFIQSFRVWVEEIINERLIPMMVDKGMAISKDDKFRWEMSENMKVKDWAEIIGMLAPHFELDEDEIAEKIGLTVTAKQEQVNAVAEPEAKKKDKEIENMYQSILNQG